MRWLNRHTKILLAAYAVFLFFALLSPSSGVQSDGISVVGRLLGFVGVPETIANPVRLEFLMNTVIFAPVPFLGSILLPSYTWRDWTAVGFAGALAVEVLQALLLLGRDGSFVDVVANTLGALVGAVLARLLRLACPALSL